MVSDVGRLRALHPHRAETVPPRTWLRERLRAIADRLKHTDGATEALPVVGGEHVVLRTADLHGRPVLATTSALYHRSAHAGDETSNWTRLGWEQIGRVSWDNGTLSLSGLFPTAPRRTDLDVAEDDSLIAFVRERVASTSLIRTRVRLDGLGTAHVLGRRQPGTDRLIWLVGVDDDIDADSATVRVAIDVALTRLRRDLGG